MITRFVCFCVFAETPKLWEGRLFVVSHILNIFSIFSILLFAHTGNIVFFIDFLLASINYASHVITACVAGSRDTSAAGQSLETFSNFRCMQDNFMKSRHAFYSGNWAQ